MEAKELRLGNYIESSIEEIGILKVLAITTARNTNYINACDIKFINPIPLTEEWLLRFGFDYDKRTSFSTSEPIEYKIFFKSFFLYNTIQKEWYYKTVKLQINNVHHLQNLYFALTNQELTIKE